MNKKLVECRDCNTEFDPNAPMHKEEGFYNQCCNCADDVVEKNKAFVAFDSEGCIAGIEVVTAKDYNKTKELEEHYANAKE